MKTRMVWKDFKRNRVVTLTVLLFIMIAAMLLSLASALVGSLFGSIDRLMDEARTPHFMQMHSGDLDMGQMERFVAENENIAAFQVVDFLNMDNSKITLGSKSLAGNVQDNGFCTQSESFDYLLDLDNVPVKPQNGELYVPVCYQKDGTAKAGDLAVIDGIRFTVAGFVRDSQMNSALASSKRFLVSEQDYERLEPLGKTEYLIEFRLKNPEELGQFETAYSAFGLPASGPALTWPLFRMISAVSDGIMIAVILLVSFLIILIALLCIRFTLLAKIEEDYREIGVMKAVGMRLSDIRSIYLTTYAIVAAAGCIAGFFLSLVIYGPMTESIRLNFGESRKGILAALFPGLLCIGGLFLFILFAVNMILRRFRKIPASQALRFGAEEENASCTGILRLSNNRWFSANMLLGIKDILARKRLYATMLVVVMLSVFIISVPQNLFHTISGDDFITYMGTGRCDIRMDIQQNGQIDEKAVDVLNSLEADPAVDRYVVLTTKTFTVRPEGGDSENIKVELGDHSVFPIECSDGRMPVSSQEIALSSMNAKELGKQVGDSLTLYAEDGERELTVCGIYSDITNGGKTAKAAFLADQVKTAWNVVCVNLADPGRLEEKLEEYRGAFHYAKISDVREYTAQTFGQTLRSVRSAAVASSVSALFITILIILLFLKLLAAKDRRSIAILKAVGFTDRDIFRQYAWRIIITSAAGIILGTILAGTVGEMMAAAAIASLGADNFRFSANPLFTGLICPMIVFLTTLAAIPAGTSGLKDADLFISLKE